jgi:hypothetical protein
MKSVRLKPLHGSELILALMNYSTRGDSAAAFCLQVLNRTPKITDDQLIEMYNTTKDRQHVL